MEFGRTKASVLLDLVRGVAAVLVCLGHWRNIFFVDYGSVTTHRWLVGPLYILCSCGHQAVMVFFVLSGYLISGSVRRALAAGQWDWRSYATHRLVRLWVVLAPGLLLCWLWDGVGLRSGLAPMLYHGLSGNHVVGDVLRGRGLGVFLGNLVFVQSLRVPVFGSDGPLWSLAYEAWYYGLFPLGLVTLLARFQVWTRVVCGVLFAVVAWFVGGVVMLYFPVWLAGAALGFMTPPRVGAGRRWVAGGMGLWLLTVVARAAFVLGVRGRWVEVVGDYVVTAGTVGVLWMLLSAREAATGARWVRVSRGMARFSFTLYVAHVPMLALLMAWLGGDVRWVPDGPHLALGVLVLVGVIGYCWVVAWGTEFRTVTVRKWVEGALAMEKGEGAR